MGDARVGVGAHMSGCSLVGVYTCLVFCRDVYMSGCFLVGVYTKVVHPDVVLYACVFHLARNASALVVAKEGTHSMPSWMFSSGA